MDGYGGFVGLLLIFASLQTHSVSGVINGDVFGHCCDLGRAWSAQSQEHCGPYPESHIAVMLYGPEETLVCTALVDACCVQARREKQCSAGRDTAALLGRCDGLHLYQANEDAKECCNCCHLGILTSHFSNDCRVPPPLSLSLTCAETFTECCLGQSPASSGSGGVSPVPPLTISSPPPAPTQVRGSGADHLSNLPPGFSSLTVALTTSAAFLDICEQFKGELCAHVCISATDSYHCECRQGFRLQSDGKSCLLVTEEEAVEEVEDVGTKEELELEATTRHQAEALDHGTTPDAVSLPPGRCRHGYAWNKITYQCEDIDECILEIHTCDPNQVCVNTEGDFHCFDELDDREIYDDYYPETEPTNTTTASSSSSSSSSSTIITTTTAAAVANSRVILRTRSRENRPTFHSRPPTTQSPAFGQSSTTRWSRPGGHPTTRESIQCLSGYIPDSRSNTCVDVNECSSGVHNCRLPNQLCVNVVGSYRCQCERGFRSNPKSNFCEDVDECLGSSSVCPIDQICENALGSFRCLCASGFTVDAKTQQCIDVDECRLASNICGQGQGQECQNVPGSYRCTRIPLICSRGYEPNPSGTQCVDVNECIQNLCSAADECENTIGSFRCRRKTVVCQNGFRQNDDQTQCIDVDECSVSADVCSGTNRNCENTVGSYVCRCVHGYGLNATTEQCDDVDECRSREFVCLRGQTCVNTPGSYECRCEVGFTLDARTKACTDVNECEQRVCNDNEICENSHGSFRCLRKTVSCPSGFTPDPPGRQCIDVDECRSKTDNCGVAWTCHNTPGSFRCVLRQCSRGHRLDHETGQCIPVVCARGMRLDHAGTCTDINECAERPTVCRPHQGCRNTVGSYQCYNTVICGNGYELNEDSGHCDDVDECQRGTHRCQGSLIQCVNRPGTYLCQCPDGYQLDHQRQSCEDIDECRHYRGHICSQNSECQNTPGSYRCICKEGFEHIEDRRSCKDIDECLQPRMCQHNCHNTWGSFRCSCNDGYQLSAADSRSCSDVDECAIWSQRGNVLCQGICENTPGSYRCSCPPGYLLGPDGRVCRDVDECAASRSTCSGSEDVCINTRGGHKCENVICPKGFSKLTNSNRNSHAIRCHRKSFTCAQGDADCLYAPISYSVNFIAVSGRLIRVPADLFTMRGPLTANRRLQFELQVIGARDPRTGAVRANRAFFNLSGVRPNEVVVQLVREIHGAQDIELQLNMNVYSKDGESSDDAEEIFFGTAVAKIFIYITEDPW